MLSTKIFLIAEKVIRDTQTDSISIINIIEQFGVAGFPIFLPSIVSFTLFEKEIDDLDLYDFEIILSLDDVEISKFNVTVNFQGKLRNRTFVFFNNVVIPHPGILKLAYYDKEKEINCYKLKAFRVGDIMTYQSI